MLPPSANSSGADRRQMVAELSPRLLPSQLLALQQQARSVHASPALIDYIQALVTFTRSSPLWIAGLSPRAGLALLAVARAWALLDGRDHVLPEDVQAVLPGVIAHRLRLHDDAREGTRKVGAGETANRLIEAVPLP